MSLKRELSARTARNIENEVSFVPFLRLILLVTYCISLISCRSLVHQMSNICSKHPLRADALWRSGFEDGTGAPPAVSAALRLRHVPVYGHREELQTLAGQAAVGGAVQPGREQRAGGGGGGHRVILSAFQQHPVDPQRWPIQGPSDHPQPAGDDPDQSVLPGLLAVWRPPPGSPQGQRPEGAQGAEEAPQPPASWGGGRGAGGGRDMRSSALHPKHPQPSHPPTPPPFKKWERLMERSSVKKKKIHKQEKKKTDVRTKPPHTLSTSKIYDTQYLL